MFNWYIQTDVNTITGIRLMLIILNKHSRKRIDVFFDTYDQVGTKSYTREKFVVLEVEGKLEQMVSYQRIGQEFLRNDSNKIELFHLLSSI
jgi:hypothetical protein